MKTKVLAPVFLVIAVFISLITSAQSAYHPDDISCLQTILANNASSSTSLNWASSTDTSSWTSVTWNSESPKRVTQLNLNSKSLIGTLDVRKLSSLQYLYTQYNYDLAGINASGLEDLYYLYCYYNNLTTLNLDGDSSLYALYCYNNSIDTLDVTSCRDLYYLYGYNNSLKSLSVKGLAKLNNLRVYNNTDLNFIDVEGCDNLGNIYVYNCSLLLSTIVPMYNLPNNPYISWYSQQNFSAALVNETFDYSDEAIIDSVQTNFILYNENYSQIETNTTGLFSVDEAGTYSLSMSNSFRSITATIYVGDRSPSISDLAILEYIKNKNFTAETSLNWDSEPNPYLWQNVEWDLNTGRVTELNLSANNSEGTVSLTGGIDVSELSMLELFRCDGHSEVTSIDVSGLSQLNELRVSNTGIQSLNLSWLTNLESLYASELDDLESVEFSGCVNLNYIKMRSNPFISLDLKGLVSLETLDLQSSSNLAEINLAGCNNLVSLYLSYTNFSSLNLSGYSNITYLDLSYNSNLTNLNIAGCSRLYNLNLGGTPFTSFDLSEFSNLAYLNFYGASSLEEIDIDGLENLYSINLGATKISSIDLSAHTNLRYIYFENAYELEEIDYSGCSYLYTLNLSGTNLTSVDVAGFTNLYSLYINRMANLEELDVEGCTNLYYLYMESTGLPSLDLSGNTRIYSVDCDYSLRMNSIDVSSCTNLYYLYSDYSDSLKSVDVDSCTRLRYLYIRDGALEKLDISTCTNLYRTYLYGNNLKELDHVGSSVRYIYVADNKLPLSQTASIANHSGVYGYTINDQDVYPDVIISVGESVDYSSDNLIDINGTDVTTQFYLYQSDGTFVDNNTTGIFTINTIGEYYVQLSNSGVTMVTGDISVIDGPGIILSITNTDFGLVTINDVSYQTLTIKNPGNTDLIVSDIVLPTDFSVDDVTHTISAGDSIMLAVAFEPTSESNYSGSITISSNSGAGDDYLSVSGTGGSNVINIQDANLYFGYINIGRMNTLSFTITNDGNTNLNITGFSLPSGYSTEQSAMSVTPGNSVEVFVSFNPGSITAYIGTLSVLSDAVYGSGDVSLIGYGVERASGLNNNEISDKAVYPNIAKNFIYLKGFDNTSEVEVYSIHGKLLLSVTPDNDNFYLNIEMLTTGSYIIKEVNSDKSYKFIKQ
jgi:hypothetical protein